MWRSETVSQARLGAAGGELPALRKYQPIAHLLAQPAPRAANVSGFISHRLPSRDQLRPEELVWLALMGHLGAVKIVGVRLTFGQQPIRIFNSPTLPAFDEWIDDVHG
jgi:hypothetical protein